MLLSLLKILIFFAVVLAIALGAVYLSENGQGLRLVYDGVEYTLGPVQLFVAVVLVVVLGWVVMRLIGLTIAVLRFVTGDETAINRYFHRARQRKGYDALAEGMLAVASGEGRLAQDKAAKAAKYLDKPHVTDVLAAQAAEVSGDRTRALDIYRRLLSDERTRFVGIRGLMRQKLADGDTATALKLAEKAYALKPKHRELQDTLLQLQTQAGDWKGARAVLKDKRRQGQLPQDVVMRRDAVLALQEASDVLAQGNSISAREAAISAAKASPDLIPAAVLAARSYIAQKDFRNASRILEKTWSVRPHPSVAAAYAEIVPDETPAARLSRFDALMRKNPDHEETRLLRAELLLAAEDFPGARRALGDLAEKHPTTRTLSIMAAIERGEGSDDAIVRAWLTRAMTASRGPQWVCDQCHNIMADWSPVCDSCGGFDTLTWREPEGSRSTAYAPAGSSAEMLPLLVGKGGAAVSGPLQTPTAIPAAPAADPAPAVAAEVPPSVGHVANVAPGMVPRESDYVSVRPRQAETTPEEPEPVMTLTDPDPEQLRPEPLRAGSDPVTETGIGTTADTPGEAPSVPNPATPKPAEPKASAARPDSRMVRDSDVVPVRPDVEPIGDD
ncbi:heme biosynthesis HemY N-terminal domain-containing protein [Paracoccus sp. DMF-8]|uniref:heme biosynthesis protein HemY n=1 Tax=Paracoccus sp. DMF-8 TaxID=3019445 RepID=UPI0023E39531|nr:heme biosynthesis HemY N-terminal domain-containing protein [Paracoccus sp. DMF-8]MDF3607688.1 heme biosynthesis HemY N-terminal domain-containing protein [Paracoccus sp. DMF-8]